ncbi:helicase [Tritrichomonas foetus]|uniref:Helicase n=1 Tax=Tritrichomonas foetus TaxID=1144522 RepID=A0A1J4JWI4_9EUKA|nr:helicase [Tritrichomonas foetus]|eukprot:OHT02808.1 helicase [Tritrichomonas foetus]
MELDIEDLPVHFPYQPYSVQVDFMQKVIESCQTRQYAILESPTGTGKTLSLLCAVFSWLRSISLHVKVIYTSRTHTQLSNVVKELKKTIFRPSVTHIASRSHLCLHEAVVGKSPGVQARLCYDLRKKKMCIYSNEDRITSSSPKLLNECLDLKEFIDECKKINVCPYLCAQMNSSKADLVLAPYTYIVDPNVRQHLPREMFLNTVLIFDEAHNFPDQCSENLSANLPFQTMINLTKTLSRLQFTQVNSAIRGRQSLDLSSLSSVSSLVTSLNRHIQDLLETDQEVVDMMSLPKSKNKDSFYAIQKDSKFLFDLFDKSGINESNYRSILDFYDNVLQNSMILNLQQYEIAAIEILQKFLDNAFQPLELRDYNIKYINNYFSVNVTNEPSISLLCFTPAPGFKQIVDLDPHTIILTSGTLSPLDSFAAELNQKFPIRLENGHVASADQVFVGIMGEGHDHQRFEFNFNNRKNTNMKKSLIDSMKKIYDIVPAGVLTFFPSFAFMEEISPNIVRMSTHKKLFIEQRDAKSSQQLIDNYQKNAVKGAALLAVCRGKMSEGLDFADEFARCVLVVGIPYPNATDYKVQFKKEWLDKKKLGMGSKWYSESAIRAVNQAIGRAIRHKNDYAAIILFDNRYLGLQANLSKWIQPSIHNIKSWDDMITELKNFYELKIHGFIAPDRYKAPKPINGPIYIPSKGKNPVQGKSEVKKSVSCESKAISALSNISAPIGLKTKKTIQKKKPTKDEMTASLKTLFSQSKVETPISKSKEKKSQDQSILALQDALQSNSKKADITKMNRSSSNDLKNKTENVCVCCNAKFKTILKMKRLKCGHLSCNDCWEMREAIGDNECPKCMK